MGQNLSNLVRMPRETNITAIQNKISQQTKIPITISYTHSITIYKHNNMGIWFLTQPFLVQLDETSIRVQLQVGIRSC